MTHFVQTDETGRILVTTPHAEFAGPEMFEFEFPDDFDFSQQNAYRIVDGELVNDPLPEPVGNQIAALKTKLAETDYVVTKVSEAMVVGEALSDEEAERYSEIITQRREWRAQINDLEASLEGGE